MKEDPRDPFTEVKQFFDFNIKSWRGYSIYTCKFCGKEKDIGCGKDVEGILRKHLSYCPEFDKED